MQKDVDDELEKRRLDLKLDEELQDTFPASDALKITRRQTERPKMPTVSTGSSAEKEVRLVTTD